ncbi:iron chelate uptake ABC transporter family permease subunit [Paracoccus homiensis]|uniref:iron chelate uptake ABC transporter family permease subunit n=1 Tax=Paracoccus homiensis TaxID=364199 RepID=UPI00398CFB18
MPRSRRPQLALAALGLLTAGLILAFMTVGAKGNWDFILPFRGRKLLGLVIIAHAVACSTVLFQTVTSNRILTPAIMGFDSLFVLCATLLVTAFGSTAMAGFDPRLIFAANAILMVAASMALYRWLFRDGTEDLHRILLIGVVVGILFRSLAEFLQRMLDPNEFMVLTDMMFASFNAVPLDLLGVASLLVGLVTLWLIPRLPRLDVMALGRPVGINLGLDWRRETMAVLIAISVLVSVSVALVGPILFFGLMAAALAHLAVGSSAHRHVLPAASLIAVSLLVGGQMLLERVFAFDTALRILVEFAGGIIFITLLVARGRR